MEKMNTATMITNMFIKEAIRWDMKGYSKQEAYKKAKEKLFNAGWYLDKDGRWKNIKRGKKTPEKTSMYKNRKDENKKLAMIAKSKLRMA